jgi:cytochrome c-type biogenesis protein CcmE
MTRKKQRAAFIIFGLVLLGAATGLVLTALRSTVTYFVSPSDIAQSAPQSGSRFRLGGLVETGSYHTQADATVTFAVTDGKASVPVTYRGTLPDLFREGQGVVAEGKMNSAGVFVADTVLAKHDERYMPPEVAAALKKAGRWQEQSGSPHPTPGS